VAMNEKKLKLGVIGCGFISQVTHIPNLSSNPNVALVGIADKRVTLASMVAKKYGIQKIYKNHHEMIKDANLDAVVVVTRRVHTAKVVKDCLTNGLNVFSEKPMAATFSEAFELLSIAKRNDLVYCVGFMRRFDAAVLNLKRILEGDVSSDLGKLLNIRMELIGGDDYCGIGPYFSTSEPKPLVGESPLAPSYIPPSLIDDYQKFLNVCAHDINLIRFLCPGHAFDCCYADYNSAGSSLALYKAGTVDLAFEWRIDHRLKIWIEKLVLHHELGEIRLELQPAFLKNQSGRLEIYKYNNLVVNNFLPDTSWAFKSEIDNFIIAALTRDFDSPLSAARCIGDYIMIDDTWKYICDK
jgi:hypothetical protein